MRAFSFIGLTFGIGLAIIFFQSSSVAVGGGIVIDHTDTDITALSQAAMQAANQMIRDYVTAMKKSSTISRTSSIMIRTEPILSSSVMTATITNRPVGRNWVIGRPSGRTAISKTSTGTIAPPLTVSHSTRIARRTRPGLFGRKSRMRGYLALSS